MPFSKRLEDVNFRPPSFRLQTPNSRSPGSEFFCENTRLSAPLERSLAPSGCRHRKTGGNTNGMWHQEAPLTEREAIFNEMEMVTCQLFAFL